MKANLNYMILLVVFLLSCSTHKNLTDIGSKVNHMILDKDFEIRLNYAVPLRMQQFALTSEYFLKVKGDSVVAFMPYYGVAHFAPVYPSEGGIKFTNKAEYYQITENKKNDGWLISFKINSPDSHYQFQISVYKNGSSDIQVNSVEKDPIGFYGELVLHE